MALLDIQAMDAARDCKGGGSYLSVTGCDSVTSVLLCL
jgi:Lanthionine-containing peptide SapB precursor RamS